MSVGKNIRHLRLMKNMTQRELGDKVGVTESMISQIERGTKSLNMNLATEITKALNCTLEDLAE